jgi:exonuclease III
MKGTTRIGAFAFALLAMPAAEAAAAQLTTLTYNVRGLPPLVIEDRTAEIAAIAPLLEDFHDAGGVIDGIESIVLLQELFYQNYYDTLTDAQTVSYAFKTAKDSSGPSGIGDGLNMLSDFSFANFDRTQWTDCHGTGGLDGSDCDTNKGYSYARFAVGDGLHVDVYNLHADAGQDSSSQLARRNNIDQLISAINTRSPAGTAVIVMGDTNSLYTRSPDDNIDSLRSGPGLTDVWVELVNGGVVPAPGPEIESGCDTDPSGPDCEMIDKVFYRSGDGVVVTPLEYSALKTEFSDAGGDLSDHIPVAVLFDISAGATTTTSTTSTTVNPSTTTTTVPSGGACADPVALTAGHAPSTDLVTASDALFILGAAVGIQTCDVCVCDADGSGGVVATDALLTLQSAVGLPVTLQCPPCS